MVLSVLRYLPALGGSTRVVQLLAEGIARRGHDVTVVTQEEPGTPSEEAIAGVRVVRIGMRHLAGFRVPRGYVRRLRTMDADVFHLHGNRIWCADYYFPFARSFGWAQAITPHGFYHYWMRPGLLRSLYYDHYFAGRIRAFDRYIALTEGERLQVIGWGYPAGDTQTIPNGIDLSEFDTIDVEPAATQSAGGLGTRRVALYVGGLYDNKRVDRLVRAVARTRGEWGLVVVGVDRPGTPYDQRHCELLARRLGARVRFAGPLPRAEVLRALRASDAYLQGSQFEGFGVSLLEAMAAGLPFVAFDAGAARELAATGAGLVVRSEEEMADRLTEVVERGEEMRKAARAAVREFTAERMVDRHLELYNAVVRHPTAPPIEAGRAPTEHPISIPRP